MFKITAQIYLYIDYKKMYILVLLLKKIVNYMLKNFNFWPFAQIYIFLASHLKILHGNTSIGTTTISSWILVFNSGIVGWVPHLKWPYKKKSHTDKSVDLGGQQRILPNREMIWSLKSCRLVAIGTVWAMASSCYLAETTDDQNRESF